MAQPHSGQGWNPYSYVLNSPLNYVAPSGFQAEPEPPPILPIYSKEHKHENLVEIRYPPREGKQPRDELREAAEVGTSMAPVDVGTTGSSSGYVPQPVTVSPEHSGVGGPGTVVGQTLLGAAEGTRDLGAGIGRMLVLNALTLGMYSGYEFTSAMWDGYDEDGLVGALNAVNPLYHIGRGAADTALAIDRDDYRTAGAAGTKTMVLAAATVFGMGRGLGAAEGSAVAAGAVRGAGATRELAQHIANVERVPMNFRRTVVLVETAEGPTLVAGGASALSAAQIAAGGSG
ncbi:hypothetical protein WMF39_05260 [Sorangium sp. So ce1504]|uniref:hypothetical protein n=1 Tax=Sorangium sp. So ce1504 TaxID=3133337 RepID=UPI003F6085D7